MSDRYGEERGWWDDDFYVAKWDTETVELRPDGNYIRESVVVLPHQCNNWVIGGEKEVRRLIIDLKELLVNPPPNVHTPGDE
jgi:hypothetical protein